MNWKSWNRTSWLGTSLLIATVMSAHMSARAAESHGLSVFGDLKYKADFTRFDYVNPDAPKGGRIVTISPYALRTFDSFNPFILKGNKPPEMLSIFESLMVSSSDEPASMYGLVAKTADVAADKLSVTFKMRPQAQFADGTPLTAEDCVFSFNILKEKGNPAVYPIMLRDVVKADAIDAHTVRYSFQGEQLRDLPMLVGGLPILSKAYYSARNFDETTLEPPVGSGAYKIGDFKQGTYFTLKRRDDYWGKDLPVMRGIGNFDEIRFEYYGDRVPEVENLKAGTIDLREEHTAVDWATGYDNVPAIKDGRLLRTRLVDDNPSGTQGWFFNTRRAKFADPRVRQAIGMAFDFELTNKTQFYDLYKRTTSYFEKSTMKATGKPGADELAILEPFRAKLPAAVFDDIVPPPVYDSSGNDRKPLQAADKMLASAGYVMKDGRRINAAGEQLSIEFLIYDPRLEKAMSGFVKNLQALGLLITQRRVDQAQYQQRQKSFDFDILGTRFTMSKTPGLGLRSYFSSQTATVDGSANLAGVQDPVVDALVDKIISANSRDELNTAARALDRVLLANYYWVPNWYNTHHNIVHWDKFSWPAIKPKYDRGILDTWWYDPEKAAKLKSN
jgi:microcin C transport system substrate-binding protein